jgi:hypothetical protein
MHVQDDPSKFRIAKRNTGQILSRSLDERDVGIGIASDERRGRFAAIASVTAISSPRSNTRDSG